MLTLCECCGAGVMVGAVVVVLGLIGSSVIKSTADFMNVTTLSHMDLMASGAWPSTPAR